MFSEHPAEGDSESEQLLDVRTRLQSLSLTEKVEARFELEVSRVASQSESTVSRELVEGRYA